jgi:hypothetical protein
MHALTGTMTGYRGDLRRFSDFVGGDAGISNIADLDRDLLHGYQRHLARVRAGPKAARRLCSRVPIDRVGQRARSHNTRWARDRFVAHRVQYVAR